MATRTARIEARVAPERRERIELAAHLANSSVSAFVVDAADEKAARILDDFRSTTLSSEYFEAVLASLDAPAVVIPALAKAASRAEEIIKRP